MSRGVLRNFMRVLAISLASTTAIAPAPFGHAAPASTDGSTINRNVSEADISAMVAQAEKYRSEGKYADAAAIWKQILAIAESLLGPEHPVVASNLNNLAFNLYKQGQYTDAEILARRSLAIREKAFGLDHPAVASSLNSLASILDGQMRYNAAEPLYRRSLTIRESSLGSNHPDIATTLSNLVINLTDQGRYAAAEPFSRRYLAIKEKALGLDHPDVANNLNILALILGEQQKYTDAEALYRRSLAISQKSNGSDHPNVATTLNNLARSLGEQGKYAAAESLYRQSLAIRMKALGPNHTDVATSLNNLALSLRDQGKYIAAANLLRQSIAIDERLLGPNHSTVARTLNNLALVLSDQGMYAAAEPFYRRSIAITEKALGPNHIDVGAALNNLALNLRSQGQHTAAEPLLRRSLAIHETLGMDNTYFATSLHNLASSLSTQGKYDAAETLFRRSLAIRIRVLGPDHPEVANSLNSLATILDEQQQYRLSEPLYIKSLAIRKKAFSPDHPEVANSLHNLASSLSDQQRFSDAEPFYRQSLSINEKALGQDHPDVASSLVNLAFNLIEQGKYAAAEPLYRRSLALQSIWLIRELPLLPDQVRSGQLLRLGSSWEIPFGIINQHPPSAELSLETRLNRHGLLPEIERRQALLINAPSVELGKVQLLQVLTQRLASVSLPSERRTAVREQRDKLQEEIYRQIPDLQIQLVSPAQVAKSLPADGALVEFQRFRTYNSRKPIDKRWGAAQYIALVLKPDGSISAVPLGAASEIDAQVHKGLSASASGFSDAEAIWAQLSTQILKPLLPHLKDSRQWFLSPDGELNRVPFAALPSPQQATTPLGQAVQLRLLTTGRELLLLQQPSASSGKAVVMANPSYDRLGVALTAPSTLNTSLNKGQRRSAEVSSKKWEPLSGSEREGLQVAQLLNSQLISGPAATTTSLKRQQGPQVLHVATHGFFVADQESQPNDPLRVLQEENSQLEGLRQEDPQLRSGLVLSGANQPTMDPNDDGYLTAAEAVTLNLKGTELVVLSACSTGQGEVRTGEGVYGLQRSLTVAGARSTLLSLWKVDDAATVAFMTSFYKRLKAGEGRSDALAAVQKEFKEGPIPAWQHPYYWAAWQLVGDWRPIKDL
jgi:CHAT domain-containing protein/tetratricopeptide (TPR) repeat protein